MHLDEAWPLLRILKMNCHRLQDIRPEFFPIVPFCEDALPQGPGTIPTFFRIPNLENQLHTAFSIALLTPERKSLLAPAFVTASERTRQDQPLPRLLNHLHHGLLHLLRRGGERGRIGKRLQHRRRPHHPDLGLPAFGID